MDRRKFITTAAWGSVSLVPGRITGPDRSTPYPPDDVTVDVSVFTCERFYDRHREHLPTIREQIAVALDYAIRSVPGDGQAVSVDVSFPEYRLDASGVDPRGRTSDSHDTGDPNGVLSKWGRALDDDVSASDRSGDANILLTARDLDGHGGRGQSPDSCFDTEAGDAAVVSIPYDGFDGFGAGFETAPRGLLGAASSLTTIVHEFGHTIGIDHRMGTVAIREDGVYTTPMIGPYVHTGSFMGDENRYGEQLPEQVPHDRTVTVSPQFNPAIPLGDLYVTESC